MARPARAQGIRNPGQRQAADDRQPGGGRRRHARQAQDAEDASDHRGQRRAGRRDDPARDPARAERARDAVSRQAHTEGRRGRGHRDRHRQQAPDRHRVPATPRAARVARGPRRRLHAHDREGRAARPALVDLHAEHRRRLRAGHQGDRVSTQRRRPALRQPPRRGVHCAGAVVGRLRRRAGSPRLPDRSAGAHAAVGRDLPRTAATVPAARSAQGLRDPRRTGGAHRATAVGSRAGLLACRSVRAWAPACHQRPGDPGRRARDTA